MSESLCSIGTKSARPFGFPQSFAMSTCRAQEPATLCIEPRRPRQLLPSFQDQRLERDKAHRRCHAALSFCFTERCRSQTSIAFRHCLRERAGHRPIRSGLPKPQAVESKLIVLYGVPTLVNLLRLVEASTFMSFGTHKFANRGRPSRAHPAFGIVNLVHPAICKLRRHHLARSVLVPGGG
jgi:hypothetical protein